MQRTNTTSTTVFNLPGPNGQIASTFEFSNQHHNDFLITIPSASNWVYWLHWHSSQTAPCDRVECLGGHILVYVADPPPLRSAMFMGTKGKKVSLSPETQVCFFHAGRKNSRREDLLIKLVADEILHRNICSAILDRDLFPFLASTPFWLRGLLYVLALWAPSIREWILGKLLAIQLRVIFHAHGFQLNHGKLPILLWWRFQIWGLRAPEWAQMLDWKAQKGLSVVVQTVCFWVGKLFFGMKGRYLEYTPEFSQTEKSPAKHSSSPHIEYTDEKM